MIGIIASHLLLRASLKCIVQHLNDIKKILREVSYRIWDDLVCFYVCRKHLQMNCIHLFFCCQLLCDRYLHNSYKNIWQWGPPLFTG